MKQKRAGLRCAVFSAAVMAGAWAPDAAAQLRPLEPVEWDLVLGRSTASVLVGAGVYWGQRASLAGLEGRLVEAGNVRVGWRSGRIMVEAGGTVLRRFDEYTRYAEPSGGAEHASGDRLRDAGAWHVATAVRLTGPDAPAPVVLRFGTRLPNPDNRVGLDRDQTDFFALAGTRLVRGPFALAAEAGLGIHGTRNPEYEQSDAVVYAVVAEVQRGAVMPRLAVMGQHDGNRRLRERGNEDLSELRLGVRAGRTLWIEADLVRGLLPHSPRAGVLLAIGVRR